MSSRWELDDIIGRLKDGWIVIDIDPWPVPLNIPQCPLDPSPLVSSSLACPTMTDISASSSSKPLLPQFMQPDDEPTAAEPARRKANAQKSSIFPFFSRARKQSTKNLKQDPSTDDASSVASTSSTEAPPTHPPVADERPLMASVVSDDPLVPEPNTLIELEGLSAPLEDDSKDVYRWAVVYENQRG